MSLVMTILLAAFVSVALLTAEPPQQDRAERIGSLIRCPVCSGESIADSPAPLARDMMSVVREQIDAGLSDEQIIEGLLASYTDSQRLDPELSATTIALWLLPGMALAGGIVLGLRELRSRPGRSEPSTPPTGAMEET
jgi:cytochrome c-type biogenesis protein CcmH